jgi:hypothetical protein
MLLLIAIVLIPAIPDIPHNEEGTKREVNDTGIEAFGRFFAQLLGRFSANRTLSGNCGGKCREKQEENDYKTPLFHILPIEGQKYD